MYTMGMGGQTVQAQPEMYYGTVDFVATPDFCLRKPRPAAWVFMIDVSFGGIQNGMMLRAIETLHEILDMLPENDDGDVLGDIGIVAFDKSIHFFNLAESREQPQILTVSDFDEPFVPIHDGFLVNPVKSRAVIEQLLQQLPVIFGENKSPDSCFGAAVAAVQEGIKHRGGRIAVMQTCLPNCGPGTLKMRDDPKLIATDKERTAFVPQDEFYPRLAEKCSDSGVSVDLFMFPSAYIDVATIGVLSSITGGHSHLYVNYNNSRDGGKFAEELRRCVTRDFGYDCLMRVRCGNGLRVTEHYGNMFTKEGTDF